MMGVSFMPLLPLHISLIVLGKTPMCFARADWVSLISSSSSFSTSVGAKISVFVLMFIGVVGFGYVITKQQLPNLMPEKPREFIVGQWQNERKMGDLEAGSSITYFEDGTFLGTYDSFVKGQGGRTQLKGTWELTPLAPNKGRLALKFNNGKQWQGTFKVINRKLTHNIEENYDSVRIPD
jgi:hypothetical protein